MVKIYYFSSHVAILFNPVNFWPLNSGLHKASMDEMDDEVEMGTVVIPVSSPTSNPPSHPPSNHTSEKVVPALVVPRPTSSIVLPGGVSARSGQKANSVKFELQPMVSQNTVSTTSLASTNIYHRDEEEKECILSKGSAKESRGIGAAMVSFSRQPSYRDSTIIDASTGKETIRVLSAKQQMFEEPQQQLSATSTRQNSGGTIAVSLLLFLVYLFSHFSIHRFQALPCGLKKLFHIAF